jgi:hypothetical protein
MSVKEPFELEFGEGKRRAVLELSLSLTEVLHTLPKTMIPPSLTKVGVRSRGASAGS